ncbi:uncharacterized protein MKK02DRAFT_45515 [Dioszegia hungarica]|uniref:Uncharacterized protein n=1 Tax=Dioszegia hungarica TaxID=4972 RepID=A0AA38LVQ7_9TREE|nr:uncharacterized protein MKK02DRAFT_45515 [Dioszegia hungarica]KAI9636808.1 hypothetical protein MKK02DRAFT_45515 [Dioszegia hungarica]
MLLTTTPAPSLPLPSHTYYPYPLTSRLKTHSSILQPLSPHAYGYQDPSVSQSKATAGPGPSSASNAEKRERHRLALKRAEERALAGKRPAGVELGKEADEMSDEEGVIQDERDHLNLFGHRFLLPYGRRQTQSEIDAAPASPTPSQEQNDRMQEDPQGGVGGNVNMAAMPASDDLGDGEEGEEVDLDASVEDMDGDDGEDGGAMSADE